MAKDMMLSTLRRLRCDGATYKSIEYTGPGVRACRSTRGWSSAI